MGMQHHCDLCGKTVAGVFSGLKKVKGQYLCADCVHLRRKGGDKPMHSVANGTHFCPYCKEEIQPGAVKCKHCGEYLTMEVRVGKGEVKHRKSALVAGFLALVLGPVGLWYKGNWAAGFAWLIMTILFVSASGGVVAPFFWAGMIVHALVAETK